MSVGQPKSALDTPVLWVDLDLLEQNIKHLGHYFKKAGVGWRPHTKGIKVPAIAHKLIDAGAIGVTCAKLGEAEVMAAAGIKDILIANQVVGPIKISRLVNLQRHADVMVAIDSLNNAQEISQAATRAEVRVRALIEVNVGMDRCGVQPGAPVVDLATKVAALPGFRLAGVMSWEGHVLGIKDQKEKEIRCKDAVSALVRSAEMCRTSGLEVSIVSCGGSGTYKITSAIGGVTEIQAGGAVFADVAYRIWGVDTPYALFVQATVISHPSATRAIVDAGRKAMSGEVVMPQLWGVEGAQLTALHAEHGILQLAGQEVHLQIGDKVDFVVGYGDSTVFLHNQLWGVRNGTVEIAWDISARGKLT